MRRFLRTLDTITMVVIIIAVAIFLAVVLYSLPFILSVQQYKETF